jgi:hypothetical protein
VPTRCQCAVLVAARAEVVAAVAIIYIADAVFVWLVLESLARSANCYNMGRGNDQKKMKFFWALPRPSVFYSIAALCCSKGPTLANLFTTLRDTSDVTS